MNAVLFSGRGHKSSAGGAEPVCCAFLLCILREVAGQYTAVALLSMLFPSLTHKPVIPTRTPCLSHTGDRQALLC